MNTLKIADGYEVKKVEAPAMPGPFVNTNLISLGKGKNGAERFWISTYNEVSGSLGVLVDEEGNTEDIRFGKEHSGLYSAVAEDENTLWLCGFLNKILRLDLDSKEFEVFETGGEPGLVFTGMVYDKKTKKLFAASRCGKNVAISFDTVSKKTHLYENEWEGRYMRFSFPNGDGTYSIVMHFPGQFLRWNPQTDEIGLSRIELSEVKKGQYYHLIYDKRWGWYLPELGWYDAKNDTLSGEGPTPEKEMGWFAAYDNCAYGCEIANAEMKVYRWSFDSGEVEQINTISNVQRHNVNLTEKGDIISVSIYGVFNIYSRDDMALKLSRVTPCKSVTTTGRLRLIDENRIVGTTFINQRFWEGDLGSGKSVDMGRAAPGAGQVTGVIKPGNGKIYITAYTGGELLEYDPEARPNYPENPRVIARHHLAQRPGAYAYSEDTLWYSATRKYGVLGGLIFRYDLKKGKVSWMVNPIGERAIRGMLYDATNNQLICGTTVNADMSSIDPRRGLCGNC